MNKYQNALNKYTKYTKLNFENTCLGIAGINSFRKYRCICRESQKNMGETSLQDMINAKNNERRYCESRGLI